MTDAEKTMQTYRNAIANHAIVGLVIKDTELQLCLYARQLFTEYNERFYNCELPQTDILFNPGEFDIYGEFYEPEQAIAKIWYNTEARPAIVLYTKAIDGKRHLKEVLLHEMAHEYCYYHSIPDIDRSGNHTEKFAAVCKAHGLKYRKGEKDYMKTVLQTGI